MGATRLRGVEAFVSRLRSVKGGFYREYAPAPDLRHVVACGWIKVVRKGADDARVAILPDGCSDVMTYDGGAPFVVGPDPVTRWAALHEDLVITGLRLRPGAARAVFGCAARELLGVHAALGDITADATALDASLRGEDTLARRLAALEAWARRRITVSRNPDRALIGACGVIARDPRVSMDAVAARVGWSPRMLHRQFVAACGYGPKHFQRVMRVQAVLRAAQAPGHRQPLSAIAAAIGFADQPHMTRDFRSITGFTPAECVADADPELGRWLDADWPL